METALRQLSPYLSRLSDGETGDRRLWATPVAEKFRANPDVELVRDSDWSGYGQRAQWKVRDDVGALNPDNIRHHYTLYFENSFPSFRILRDRFDRSDLRFQVGILAPLDIAFYCFGEIVFEDDSIVEACTEATLREIDKIAAQAGDEVVFQLETVGGLVSVARTPPEEQPEVARNMVANMIDVAARSPEGTRFGAHLCLGDFQHKALGHMDDARPIVELTNALAAGWPEGRVLEYVHAPFAAADEPPVAEEAFYEPLRDLRLPAATRFIAGFQHESLDLDGHRELLARIERLSGREVDIAAACGLGRRPTDEEAFAQMRETAALLGDEAP